MTNFLFFLKLGKLLWVRATGSTVISQILDSFVVSYLAFSLGKELSGQTPASFEEVLNIASTGKYVRSVVVDYIFSVFSFIFNFFFILFFTFFLFFCIFVR